MENLYLAEFLQKQNTEMWAQYNNATKAKHIVIQVVGDKFNVILNGEILGYLTNFKVIKTPKIEPIVYKEKDGTTTATFAIKFGLYEADFWHSEGKYFTSFDFETSLDFENQILDNNLFYFREKIMPTAQ